MVMRHLVRFHSIRELLIPAAFLLCLTAAPAPAEVLGQPQSEKVRDECALTGLGRDAVKKCFGDPDSVEREMDGEIWTYDQSELHISGDRVVAWLNAEELQQRRRIASLKKRTVEKEDDPTDTAHWENEWTPRKAPRPQDELLDLAQ